MNIRADLRGIGVIALTAVVVMAIVSRWPAIRRVILPQAEPVGVGVPVVRRHVVRRPRRRIWV